MFSDCNCGRKTLAVYPFSFGNACTIISLGGPAVPNGVANYDCLINMHESFNLRPHWESRTVSETLLYIAFRESHIVSRNLTQFVTR